MNIYVILLHCNSIEILHTQAICRHTEREFISAVHTLLFYEFSYIGLTTFRGGSPTQLSGERTAFLNGALQERVVLKFEKRSSKRSKNLVLSGRHTNKYLQVVVRIVAV